MSKRLGGIKGCKISALVASPKKLLYTVANPAACGLLNRGGGGGGVWQRSPPPPPSRAARSEKIKNKNKKSRGASTRLGAT